MIILDLNGYCKYICFFMFCLLRLIPPFVLRIMSVYGIMAGTAVLIAKALLVG